jgi:hypothetical protein
METNDVQLPMWFTNRLDSNWILQASNLTPEELAERVFNKAFVVCTADPDEADEVQLVGYATQLECIKALEEMYGDAKVLWAYNQNAAQYYFTKYRVEVELVAIRPPAEAAIIPSWFLRLRRDAVYIVKSHETVSEVTLDVVFTYPIVACMTSLPATVESRYLEGYPNTGALIADLSLNYRSRGLVWMYDQTANKYYKVEHTFELKEAADE